MRYAKDIDIPFVTLTEADLAAIASHVDAVAQVRRSEVEREVGSYTSKAKDETDEDHGARVSAEVEARRVFWGPTFAITTRDGSLSDDTWEALWLRGSDEDMRVVSMSARNSVTSLTVRLSLTGSPSYGSKVAVDSESEGEMQRETGFFSDLFRRRNASERRLASTQSPIGWLLWFGAPSVSVGLLTYKALVLGGVTLTTGQVLTVLSMTVLMVGTVVALVAYGWIERVAPRIVIRARGPYRTARQRAIAVLLFILTVAAGAALTLLWS